MFILMLGCTPENTFVERPFESIAVVTGDFDQVEASFNRLDIAYIPYEGYITTAAYDESIDPDLIALKSESLFTGEDSDGNKELFKHDALFVNSGARGFAEVMYKESLDADDQFVSDEQVIADVRDFVDRGRTVWVSDWGYELVEAAWPDRIDFYGDDETLEAAEVGASGRTTARIIDSELQDTLGTETASLELNFTNWALMDSVADDVEVVLRGDVGYRISAEEGWGEAEQVPLLVRFEVGSGTVVFSSFHWHAQNAAFADALLVEVVPGLDVGSADDGATPSEDTGDGTE